MNTIIPAIIPRSESHLRDEIRKLITTTIGFQIDITDGVFTPHTSWPYCDDADISAIADVVAQCDIEFDLMVNNPEELIGDFCALSPARVVFHTESSDAIHTCIEHVRAHCPRTQVGIALLNDTPFSIIEHHVDAIDYVQLMGIAHIGAQGADFDPRVIKRCEELKATHPHIFISIDGSMNETTIPKVRTAGADRFVVGSAIFGADDPVAAFHTLQHVA